MRREISICLSLCLILFAPTLALADAFAVNWQTGGAVIAADGTHLTPAACDYVEKVAPARFAVYEADEDGDILCRVLDDTGAVVGDQTYDGVYESGRADALMVQKDGKYGLSDLALSPILEPEYTQLVENGQGGYLALVTDPYDDRPDGVYLVDEKGEERATGVKIEYGLGAFTDNLMPVVSAESGRMGYLGPDGNFAIAPQYEYAGDFHGGMAEACLDTGAGVIDASGNWLLTPRYQTVSLGGADGRMILAQQDGALILLIDPDTFKVKRRFEGTDIYFSAYSGAYLAALYMDESTLLVDYDGKTLLECPLDARFDAWSAKDGRVAVRMGEWGESNVWLYDLSGSRVYGPCQELWSLGKAGETSLYACASFEVTEEVDPDIVWRAYVETPGTRTLCVVNQNGDAVLGPFPCEYIQLIDGKFIACESESAVEIFDLSGQPLTRIEK